MGSSKDYEETKTLILSKRKLMIKLREDHHWLDIHIDVRKALEHAFKKLLNKQIATIIGFNEDTVQKWRTEEKLITELRVKVDICRANGKQHLKSILIRSDACKLAKLVGTTKAAQAVGIARASLYRWVKDGWDEVDASNEIKVLTDIKNVPPKPSENARDQFDKDAEVKQLDIFLERHKGKIRKKYSLSEKKLILGLVERFGSKFVHDRYGVSYDTISRLKRRKENDLERKARVPMRYIPVIEIMRKHPGMGPTQIRDYIRRHLGLSMGVNSIRKVMEQSGWVPPFVKSSRISDGIKLYEAARRDYLWHMDFKHQYVNRCKVFILFIQDDYSRFIVGHGISNSENIDIVLTTVEEGIRIHGKPEVIMTDGGSAFFSWRGCSKFTRYLEDFGIEQLIAQTPNVNGKLENLNGQVEKELIIPTNFASVHHFQKELAKWVAFYNFTRPHQGLANTQVPADRYFPGAKQWYGEASNLTKQQSLIAETMATLLSELKKPK